MAVEIKTGGSGLGTSCNNIVVGRRVKRDGKITVSLPILVINKPLPFESVLRIKVIQSFIVQTTEYISEILQLVHIGICIGVHFFLHFTERQFYR